MTGRGHLESNGRGAVEAVSAPLLLLCVAPLVYLTNLRIRPLFVLPSMSVSQRVGKSNKDLSFQSNNSLMTASHRVDKLTNDLSTQIEYSSTSVSPSVDKPSTDPSHQSASSMMPVSQRVDKPNKGISFQINHSLMWVSHRVDKPNHDLSTQTNRSLTSVSQRVDKPSTDRTLQNNSSLMPVSPNVDKPDKNHSLQSNHNGSGPVVASRYAIAFYGGITGLNGKFAPIKLKRLADAGTTDVNISLIAAMLRKNLIGDADDVFIHSWSPLYRTTFDHVYHPKAAVFENNTAYKDELNQMAERAHGGTGFNQVSMLLSISKVLKLIAEYQAKTMHTYDAVYLTRPDVLLRKQIRLERAAADEGTVFFNSDFHYLMSGRNVNVFSTVYESVPLLKRGGAHSRWIYEFCNLHNLRAAHDGTKAGRDEEVIRKIFSPFGKLWRDSLAGLLPSDCLDALTIAARSDHHRLPRNCSNAIPQD